ncbi:Protein of unknown function with HXXEE motif-containing protein [Streptoalloteichus tenebrarius]|uniref:HXXEE domain-containing protein n=1 Tax=Streptoalloteichus tenebrarius (strain ATCC 17920 / DSM 40477 / JCM 4838 / CBS 697.72 / NBRC 16177 / NCIMB 11028 / NRRL B-12390 / A12253. 1 / ISP 5477) TaxID=1933 RepID=A0ABT1HVP2_STRSD|nr:HXXEE domain-containing protein [Streptoalloteichus tenebrarius]MCP2259585.1 Protein of unknown function with HXXEE motif-containing protein [Streptoalloteichus tenebrarius]BFF01008.1 hypothetical protein GCM10020241_26830 [Streptoalloteichus tenebrarius]
MSDSTVPKAATWGLFAAWAAHDAEELLTMAEWSRRHLPELRRRHPWVPGRVWSALEMSRAQAAVAIGLMGVVFASAAAAGARTGGRSGWYQTVLAAFGWHALTHVAQAAALRRYTPGVLTAPTVVAPFSWWAWRTLRRAGVVREGGRGAAVGMALFPLVAGAVHAVARAATRRGGPGGR